VNGLLQTSMSVLLIFRAETYADRVACCPLVSHGEYAPRALIRLRKNGTDRQRDGQTDARPLHYASVLTRDVMLTDLDVAGSNERRFAFEVSRVDDADLPGVEDELSQVDFAAIDGVQKGRAAGGQALAVVRVIDLELGL